MADCAAKVVWQGQAVVYSEDITLKGRYQMLQLKDNLYYVGVQDEKLRVFDIIMQTPYGTSYNAYVLKGSEKTALIEAAKLGFAKESFSRIEEIVPLQKLDYLIINHTEPDHAGSIPLLLEKNPDLVIVGSSSAISFVTNIIKQPFKSRVVKKGDKLDLGDRQLEFYPMPNLHWPDSMFTYDPVSKALFTCDFFGAHYSYGDVLLSRMADRTAYRAAQYQYFMDIMAPFKQPFAANGLKCALELQPDIICTGHGPVLDTDLDFTYERHALWVKEEKAEGKRAVVAYVSAYDYTKAMAERLYESLRRRGIDTRLMDITKHTRQEMLDAIDSANGILFGSPTFLGDMLKPVSELMAALYPFMVKGKLFTAFGSYGWSGEAVPYMLERAAQLKMKTIEGIKFRMRPSEEELAQLDQFAEDFVKAL